MIKHLLNKQMFTWQNPAAAKASLTSEVWVLLWAWLLTMMHPQADGGELAASICVASAALADAAIDLMDLLPACTVVRHFASQHGSENV
jgi:hypothetical protein